MHAQAVVPMASRRVENVNFEVWRCEENVSIFPFNLQSRRLYLPVNGSKQLF